MALRRYLHFDSEGGRTVGGIYYRRKVARAIRANGAFSYFYTITT